MRGPSWACNACQTAKSDISVEMQESSVAAYLLSRKVDEHKCKAEFSSRVEPGGSALLCLEAARMSGSSRNCSIIVNGSHASVPISARSCRVGKSGWCARIWGQFCESVSCFCAVHHSTLHSKQCSAQQMTQYFA